MDWVDGCELARVVRGIEPSQAVRAAELFYASFGEKLAGLILPDDRATAIALLAATFYLDNVYAALDSSGRVGHALLSLLELPVPGSDERIER